MSQNRIVTSLLSFTLLLAACAAPSTPPASAPTEVIQAATLPPAPAHTPSIPTEEADTGVTVVDATGQEITLPALPERLAVAGRAGQMILHALYLFPEASDRIVAMEQRLQRNTSMLPLIDPEYGEKSQFERDAAAEQIAPTQPDIVLLKSYLADSLGEPLQQIGIPVVYMDLETPESFFYDIDVMATLLDNPERAEDIKAFYQSRLDELQDQTAELTPSDRPRVLLLQYSDRGGEVAFNVPPASWLQTTMVETVGGEPVWLEASETGGWTVVGFEQIAAWDPDQIFIVNYFGNPSETVAELLGDPNWQALRAVANGQLYAFPGDFLSWDQPDTRWILGLEWLATKIQPEIFGEIDILEEARDFYSEMYGLDQANFDTEVLPLITGDI